MIPYKIIGTHKRIGREVEVSTKRFTTIANAEHFAKFVVGNREFTDLKYVEVDE